MHSIAIQSLPMNGNWSSSWNPKPFEISFVVEHRSCLHLCTRLERKEEVSGLFMDARTNKKKKKMSLLGNIFVSSCFFFFFSCCIREKNFLAVKENENMDGRGLKGNRLQQKWGEEKDALIEISAKNEAKLNWLWSFCASKWNEDNQVILWDGESELETETKPESVLERVCV